MDKHIKGFIQGMLDARANADAPKGVINPYNLETESELWDYWWEGFNNHRDPIIVT